MRYVLSREGQQILAKVGWLSEQLGHEGRMPIVGVRHHDAHAYLSYGVSPFT